MPRRAAAQIRTVEPDAVHRNRLVQQVINKVMLDGKKSTAEQIVYDALAILGERTGKNPLEVLEAGVKALTPVLEVRSRRVGGATYQVPVEVPPRRARTLAVRWLVSFARQRREKTMAQRLANELLDASSSRATHTSARTTSTGWRRPTRPSHTTAGSGARAGRNRGRRPVRVRILGPNDEGRPPHGTWGDSGPTSRSGNRSRPTVDPAPSRDRRMLLARGGNVGLPGRDRGRGEPGRVTLRQGPGLLHRAREPTEPAERRGLPDGTCYIRHSFGRVRLLTRVGARGTVMDKLSHDTSPEATSAS